MKIIKAFTFVETMVLITVMSAILVAAAPLVTRKTRTLPASVRHGMYICKANNNGGGYTEKICNSETCTETNVKNCEFKPPIRAGIFRVELYGAGAGGNSFTDSRLIQESRDMTYGRSGSFDNSILAKPLTESQIRNWFNGVPINLSCDTPAGGKGGDVKIEYIPSNCDSGTYVEADSTTNTGYYGCFEKMMVKTKLNFDGGEKKDIPYIDYLNGFNAICTSGGSTAMKGASIAESYVTGSYCADIGNTYNGSASTLELKNSYANLNCSFDKCTTKTSTNGRCTCKNNNNQLGGAAACITLSTSEPHCCGDTCSSGDNCIFKKDNNGNDIGGCTKWHEGSEWWATHSGSYTTGGCKNTTPAYPGSLSGFTFPSITFKLYADNVRHDYGDSGEPGKTEALYRTNLGIKCEITAKSGGSAKNSAANDSTTNTNGGNTTIACFDKKNKLIFYREALGGVYNATKSTKIYNFFDYATSYGGVENLRNFYSENGITTKDAVKKPVNVAHAQLLYWIKRSTRNNYNVDDIGYGGRGAWVCQKTPYFGFTETRTFNDFTGKSIKGEVYSLDPLQPKCSNEDSYYDAEQGGPGAVIITW